MPIRNSPGAAPVVLAQVRSRNPFVLSRKRAKQVPASFGPPHG
jgi:hypothetical protein